MRITGEENTKRHIKQGIFEPVYLITGDDDYITQFYRDQLENGVCADKSGFNYHPFGKELEVDAFIESCESMPMFSDRILVSMRDFNPAKLNADVLDEILKYLPNTPKSTTVVFCFPSDYDLRNKKTASLIKTVEECGVHISIPARTSYQLASTIMQGAKKRETSISREDAMYLVGLVGDDMSTLLRELEKLCAFADTSPITREMIDTVCVKSVQASVFDLFDAIMSRDADKSYAILGSLIKQNTEPTLILGTLAGEYADLYRMKLAKIYSGSKDEISKTYEYKNRAFRLDSAAVYAKRFSLEEIKSWLDALNDTDMKIKFSSVNNTLALERLLAVLLGTQS